MVLNKVFLWRRRALLPVTQWVSLHGVDEKGLRQAGD